MTVRGQDEDTMRRIPSAPVNAAKQEYLDLWNTVVGETDSYRPATVFSGLVTFREKISMDQIDLIGEKQRQLQEKRAELIELDQSYLDLIHAIGDLKQSKQEADAQSLQMFENPDVRAHTVMRLTDFFQGLIMKLSIDFSKESDLVHYMQKLYLFTTKNLKDAEDPEDVEDK